MNLKIRFVMLPLATLFFASAVGAPPAQTLIDSAIQKAKAENKAIFVHFSASW